MTEDRKSYCRACPAEILWCTMPGGARNPLDVADTWPPLVGKGIVAYNPATRNGMMVTAENIERAEAWAQKGVTFHVSHWATCPARKALKEETKSGDTVECPVPGCTNRHARSLLMCPTHWRPLAKRLRDRLWKAYDRGAGVATEEYAAARQACIDAASALKSFECVEHGMALPCAACASLAEAEREAWADG
jgi:hypothetical protein